VSESVEQVLLTALAKDPNDRFENVDRMVMALKTAWLNADGATQKITSSSVASMTYRGATSNVEIPAAKKSTSPKKWRMEWLYILVGIALGIGLAFSLVPNLRGRLYRAIMSARTPAALVEFTPTNSATTPPPELTPNAQRTGNQGTAVAATPTPNSTNTSASNLTARLTQTAPIVVTPPPVIATVINQATVIPTVIETLINQVTVIPPIISSVLPLP